MMWTHQGVAQPRDSLPEGKKLPHWWQGVPKSKGKASGEEEGEGEGGLHWRLRAPGPAPNRFSIRSGKARTGA